MFEASHKCSMLIEWHYCLMYPILKCGSEEPKVIILDHLVGCTYIFYGCTLLNSDNFMRQVASHNLYVLKCFCKTKI